MDGTAAPVVSVVMPAHNEEPFLAASVGAVVAGLEAQGRPFEVIVVENGSTDDTAALATELAAKYEAVQALSRPEPDYGNALRAGFLAASGDVVVNFDVDYFDLAFLDAAVARVLEPGGPSVIVGSKRGAGSNDTRSPLRRLVTLVFSTILKVGFGLQVSDTHGVKALRRLPLVPVVEVCKFGTDLFDTELILRAERAGLQSAEIPVVVEETRPSRSSILRRVPRSILGLVKLRIALWRS